MGLGLASLDSVLLAAVIQSLAKTVAHRGEKLLMAELCNSLLHRTLCSRLLDLQKGVEVASSVMENAAWFGEINRAVVAERGLEFLLQELEVEGEEEGRRVEERERRLRDKERRAMGLGGGHKTFVIAGAKAKMLSRSNSPRSPRESPRIDKEELRIEKNGKMSF